MTGLALCLLALGATASEAEPLIASDRPGFSFAAGVVPRGRWQTEVGLRGRISDGLALDVPVASARLGLGRGFELQLGLPSLSLESEGEGGIGSISAGFKYGVEPADWVALSLVGLLVAPTGDIEVAEPGWQLLGAVNVELYFAGDGWVSLNTQVDTFASRSARRVAISPSAALGWTLFDVLNPYLQVVARVGDGAPRPLAGAGVAWLVSSQLQLDVSADYDIDGESVSIDTGFSVLW